MRYVSPFFQSSSACGEVIEAVALGQRLALGARHVGDHPPRAGGC